MCMRQRVRGAFLVGILWVRFPLQPPASVHGHRARTLPVCNAEAARLFDGVALHAAGDLHLLDPGPCRLLHGRRLTLPWCAFALTGRPCGAAHLVSWHVQYATRDQLSTLSALPCVAAGGAERKHFLKQVVTTPDASMVIGEHVYAASHLQRPLTHLVLPVQHFLPVPCRLLWSKRSASDRPGSMICRQTGLQRPEQR
jgi:hypothetical protein